MTLEIIYSPQAIRGMNEIADYLAQQSPGLGLRFLRAVEEASANLAAMPEMAGQYESDDPRLADQRVWPLREFPNLLVFYRINERLLEVVHVVYCGRDLKHLL